MVTSILPQGWRLTRAAETLAIMLLCLIFCRSFELELNRGIRVSSLVAAIVVVAVSIIPTCLTSRVSFRWVDIETPLGFVELGTMDVRRNKGVGASPVRGEVGDHCKGSKGGGRAAGDCGLCPPTPYSTLHFLGLISFS